MAKKKSINRKDLHSKRQVFEARARSGVVKDDESFMLLAAGVAHEFNNLLGAAHGHAEWGLESLNPEDMKQALEAVCLVCERSSQLTSALQSFAQPKEEKWVLSSPKSLVEEALRILEPLLRQTRCELRLNLLDVNVMSNADQLLEVFVNLIKNALEAFEEENPSRKPFLSIGMEHEGNFLNIHFEDNGVGIPEAYRDVIFRPFWTSKGVLKRVHQVDTGSVSDNKKGSGLGLFLARKILLEHGGNLTLLDSDLGSHFLVTLPFQL